MSSSFIMLSFVFANINAIIDSLGLAVNHVCPYYEYPRVGNVCTATSAQEVATSMYTHSCLEAIHSYRNDAL